MLKPVLHVKRESSTEPIAVAVNTVCYVQNRVLVVKPHNKISYELFHGKTPTLSFMRPFGCPVTILNIIEHLGKFGGKVDEGFFVRYSLNSKAFRVFNRRTRIVEENLHIKFSKSTPNVIGSGPYWLFDIDALTRTINYKPIVVCTQSYSFAGIKASDNKDPKSSHDDGSKPSSDDGKKVDEDPSKRNECKDQEKEDNVNSTNNVNIVSSTINITGINEVNADGEIISSELPFDSNMHALEDVSIFNFSNDDEYDGAMADMNNLDTTIQVSPIPTKRIHKDHPLDQVIRDLHSATQTKKMLKNLEKHGTQKGNPCIERSKLDKGYAGRASTIQVTISLDLSGFTKWKKGYRLHQAPRSWYETLSTYLLDNGFQRGRIDKTLFIKRHKGDILLVQVYMDDTIYGSTKKELCIAFKNMMHKKFQMSSMGELTFFLGLQVNQKKDGIFISQDKYVAKFLKKFGFTEVKTASTPMETQKPLLKDEDSEEVDVYMYRNQVNPKVSHLYVVKRIFSAKDKTINEEAQIHAKVDGKKIIVTKSFVRRDLQLVDEGGIDCLPNSTIFEQLALMRKPKRKDTQVPQLSGPTESIADEAIHKELGDRLVRAATIASGLKVEQDSGGGPRCQETMRNTIAQTRFENVFKKSNDSLLVRGNTLQSDEDRMKLNELMDLCTNLQTRVLNLEKTKTTQANKIASLKRRVKKLEKRNRSRTHKLKRLYKVGLTARVESFDNEESLGEDASKLGRKIDAIDADKDITLVSVQDDTEMFDVNDDLGGEEVFVEQEVAGQNENVVKEEISDFATPGIQSTFNESLENVVLAKSSSQPQSTYEAIASLTEFELKKILLDKLEKSKLYRAIEQHKDLYDALAKCYQLNKDLFDYYGKRYSLKRGREDKFKDEDSPAGSDQELKKRKTSKDAEPLRGFKSKESKSSSFKGSKSQSKSSGKSTQAEEPVFKTADTEMPHDQGDDMGNTEDEPNVKEASKHGWFKKPERPPNPNRDWNAGKQVDFRPPRTWIIKMAKARKPPTTFDELMSTPIDYSAYVLHNLKIKNLTQEHLVGPSFNLLKGTCKSRVELEFHFEECYKAVIDKLDWTNPKGHAYPFDLRKHLPLIEDQGHQVVPANYFFNNDLEYPKGRSLSRKYTTSTTKTKAAKYDTIEGIEDMVRWLWILVKVAYDKYAMWGISHWVQNDKAFMDMQATGSPNMMYSPPKESLQEDQKLYKFVEGDFPRLNMRNIEDMLLLFIQKKLSNLERDDLFDLNMALRMVLHDIASSLEMDYFPKIRWSKLDRKRSRIMIKTYGITYNVPNKYKYKTNKGFQSTSKAEDVFQVLLVIKAEGNNGVAVSCVNYLSMVVTDGGYDFSDVIWGGCYRVIIMVNIIPPDHVDEVPVVESNQHDDVPVVPELVLMDEDKDPKEDEFEEEEDPQGEEDDMEIDIEEDENEPELTYPYEEVDPLNPSPSASESEPDDEIEVENPIEHEDETVPASVHEVGESSAAPFLREDSNTLLPGLMGRDINSLFGQMASISRRLYGRETAHALVEKKGKAKDKFYGKLILELGNEVRSSVEQGTTAIKKLVEKLGNTKDKVKCKKVKKELKEAKFSNTFLRMQNERVKRDLY
uniref:Putative ribonuclease H-like domain-containing protein n=1 Tax=Tanacetum cinerariifolium TaxID=118510 RepID=A0A6L2MEF4_TANCI|nr:putative ribonuclease H-like domain-containing protein [Tanacetum cinerariifolium]